MVETQKVFAAREGVRTLVMHGEGVRHPHTPDYVSLSMINPLMYAKASMQMLKDGSQKTNAICHVGMSNHTKGGTRSWESKAKSNR